MVSAPICVPISISIGAGSGEAVKTVMNRAFTLADMVELRIDGMKNPNLADLLHDPPGPVLVTNRRKEEGGAYTGSELKRIGLLEDAIALGAQYVDVEASTDGKLIDRIKARINAANHSTKSMDCAARLILSWHDFRGTPTEAMLQEQFHKMQGIGADIIKMVTFAESIEDNLRLLNLLAYGHRQGQEMIAFCMGTMGRPSRIMAPLFGSCMTYASLEAGTESAPGQLTAGEMKQIWEIMAI
ncbi:MAG: 3-dehydroquinate dehydratase [Syntrophus sp. SKADARSKE-3]|nr:3-dehydroquinate dehydratase [Syntrophus sp. SKADARSKE-3]